MYILFCSHKGYQDVPDKITFKTVKTNLPIIKTIKNRGKNMYTAIKTYGQRGKHLENGGCENSSVPTAGNQVDAW